MGMTDMQFKAYVRKLIRELERVLEVTPDNKPLQEMILELRKDLEG